MTEATEGPRGEFLFAALVLLNSIWIFYVYLSVTQMGTFEPAKLSRALEGTAERPYVYRELVSLLARGLAPFIPTGLVKSFSSAPIPIRRTFAALSEGGYQREAAAVLLLIYVPRVTDLALPSL